MANVRIVLETASTAKDQWETRSDTEKLEFLSRLLWNPRLRGRTVEFDLRKPFAVLAKMVKTDEWRPHGDSNPSRRRERAVS